MIYLNNNATTQSRAGCAAMLPYGSFTAIVFGAHIRARDAQRPSSEPRKSRRFSARMKIVITSRQRIGSSGRFAAPASKAHIITTRVEHEAVRNLCAFLEHEEN
jgi:cysteine sulfinate desulfinase/cysteine desulfurase-like protein